MTLSKSILSQLLTPVRKVLNLPPEIDTGPLGEARLLSEGSERLRAKGVFMGARAQGEKPVRPLTIPNRDGTESNATPQPGDG
jgi:hypothetical protein